MTEKQQDHIAGALVTGCPIETGADLVGIDTALLQQMVEECESLQKRLRRARASAEVHHVQNIKNASQESKNWRASVWWLEHCLPDKYGKRPPNSVPADRFDELLQLVVAAINDEVHANDDRQRLHQRLQRLASGEPVDRLPVVDPWEEDDADVEM